MTEFEKVYKLFKRFPKKNEYDEEQWDIKEYPNGKKVLFVATSDSYCWGSLIFDEKGKFIGFDD